MPALAVTTAAAAPHKMQMSDRRRQQLLQAVADLRVLPTSSVVPMRMLQLQRTPGVKLSDYTDALAADAGLAAKLLAIANAQVQPPAAPVHKLSAAVAMLGLDNLMPLVFGLSLGGMFNKMTLPPNERLAAWRCSLLKGFVAREYADAYAPDVREEAFLLATAQDVALPLIYGTDRAGWLEVSTTLAMEDDADRNDREAQFMGTDHAALGAKVLERVAAPALLAKATAAHHQGLQALAEAAGEPLSMPLYLASLVPHRADKLTQPLIQRLAQVVISRAGGVRASDAQDALRRAGEQYAKALAQFGDGEETSAAFKEFMQSMCGQVALTVEAAVRVSSHTISDLRVREATLQGAVNGLQQKVLASDFDPLTKVLNRRGFIERATKLLDAANRQGQWCALGFMDMDNFKRLNDGYGHATGDAALIAAAGRLRDATKGRGIAGRMGGDEFCFMLVSPGGELDQTEADRLRVVLGGLQVEANGETVAFTTSVGLLSLGKPPCPHSFDTALERADELMYQGKRSGKNCCIAGRIEG